MIEWKHDINDTIKKSLSYSELVYFSSRYSDREQQIQRIKYLRIIRIIAANVIPPRTMSVHSNPVTICSSCGLRDTTAQWYTLVLRHLL
jgi:hypothetical protein